MITLGGRMRKIRRGKDMTLKELAKLIGTTEMTLSRYENNINEPNLEMIKKIAQALNTSSEELIGLERPNQEIGLTKDEIQNTIIETVTQLNDETTKETIRAILRIKDIKERQRVLQLIKMFSEEIDN